MNTILKLHLTFTVVVLFFFNVAIAKEASIRALVINPEIVKPPIEAPPGFSIPTMPTKFPIRPIAVQPRPSRAPTIRTVGPGRPTQKPTIPIKVPTRRPIQRFPSVVVAPAIIQIPLN